MSQIIDILDRVRETLNDEDEVRWPNEKLLYHANNGLSALFTMRPDLFVGQYTTFLPGTLTLASSFPLEAQYEPVLEEFILSMAHRKDSEAQDPQAVPAWQFFLARIN